ncbi:Transposase IS66 family protein [Ensifer sp. YR511]|nr:Transposase IS66 family protein [Ensifer sp. YR511]
MLWSIEEKVHAQPPDVRVEAREETSAAVVANLYKLWQDTLPRIPGKSKLTEAIRYALSRREAFETSSTTGGLK